jgi:hypothetical protein
MNQKNPGAGPMTTEVGSALSQLVDGNRVVKNRHITGLRNRQGVQFMNTCDREKLTPGSRKE